MPDIPISRPGPLPQMGQFRAPSGGGGFRVSLEEIQRAAGSAPMIDARGFVQEASGRGAVGEAVTRVAEIGQRMLMEHNASVNRRRMDEMEVELDTADTSLAEKLAGERDTTKWDSIAKEHAMEWRKTLLDDKTLSIDAKQARASRFAKWQGKVTEDTRRAAFSQAIKMEAAGLEGDRITAMQNGEFGYAKQRTEEALKRGLIGPDVAARQMVQAADEEERYKQKARAGAARAATDTVITSVESGGLDAALKMIDDKNFGAEWGATPGDKETLRNQAQAVARDRRAADAEKASDMMAKGELDATAQVDAFQSVHMTPTDRAELKALVEKRQSAEWRAQQEDPAYQDALYGKLLARAKAWKPGDTDESTNEYLSILRDAEGLKVATIKNDITEPLARKRTAKQTPPDGILKEYVSDSLARLHERGLMGHVPRDEKGKVTDPKAEDSAARKLSRTQRLMNDWLQRNPNATEEAADTQALKVIGGNLDVDAARAILGDKDSGPSAVLFTPPSGDMPNLETSGAVTSYGYASDPHADPLSAARIGAFSGQAAEDAAKAGKDHPLLLHKGDLAVSPDVEKQLRDAGVEPGDFVTVTLANGKRRTVRWMDRTANDAQAAGLGLPPLRGRWDFYSPGGEHADNGANVVSFSKVSKPKN